MKWFRLAGACIALLLGLLPAAWCAEESPAKVLRDGLITVETPAGLENYGSSVLSHATAAMRRLNEATGDALLTNVRFVVAADERRFLELAGGEGEQSLAVSLGGQQTIVISRPAMARSGADKIQQVLVHELAHVYLDVRCTARVPRWVHEGVAQIVGGEWTDAPGDGAMALAAYTGGLVPLADLVESFPLEGSGREIAYAESYSAMRFVVREDHGNSLQHFLKAIRGDEGREYLKQLSGGVDLVQLQARWRGELRSPVFVVTLLLGSGFFWGIAALLAVAAYVVVRRRSKRIRARWAAEEAWAAEMGEPPHEAEWLGVEQEGEWMEGDGEEWKRGQ